MSPNLSKMAFLGQYFSDTFRNSRTVVSFGTRSSLASFPAKHPINARCRSRSPSMDPRGEEGVMFDVDPLHSFESGGSGSVPRSLAMRLDGLWRPGPSNIKVLFEKRWCWRCSPHYAIGTLGKRSRSVHRCRFRCRAGSTVLNWTQDLRSSTDERGANALPSEQRYMR